MNLASFYEITKAIGGVEVCLNKPVNDDKSGAHFPAGVQTISGADALSFVVQPLQCHFAVHAGHHHFAVLGALPAGDDHVVAVEDSIVHHRVAAHFQNEVLSARRQTFGNGDRLVGLLHLERLPSGDRSEQRKLTHPGR